MYKLTTISIPKAAPALIKASTTARLPCLAATCKGVHLLYKQEIINVYTMCIYVRTYVQL